jgi:hypothetical protein
MLCSAFGYFPCFVTQRAALLDIYAISQEQGMPIDKLMDMYLPDTSTAFKAWIVSEMRRIDDEQQQQQQGYAASNAAAAAANPNADAPGALGGVYSSAAAAGAAAMSGAAGALGGPGGPTMQALKARMNQLQGEKARILTQSSPTKQPPAVPAAAVTIAAPAAIAAVPSVGVASAPLAAPSSIAAAAGVAAAEGSVGGASSGGGSGRLQDLRSRMKGMGL